MEIQHVIKKALPFIIILFSFIVNAQEENTDYYVLYKGGEKIKKKDVFIKYNKDFEKSIYSNTETFVYKNKIIFQRTEKKCNVDKNVTYNSVEELHNIETEIIQKEISKVKKEKGFQPVFPLDHVALKVHLIKNNQCFVVDWVGSRF
jgi:hypothetical protein